MGFLDYSEGFQNSIFNEQHLASARINWKRLIYRIDPKWWGNPKGFIGKIWRSNIQRDVEKLISLMIALEHYYSNISLESRSAFLDKVHELLYMKSAEQYEELTAELLIGACLAYDFQNMEVDPLVRPLVKSARRGRTPDYSINLNGMDVYFESTVLRSGVFDEWRKATDKIRSTLDRRLEKLDASSDVEVVASLGLRQDMLSDKVCTEWAKRIASERKGELKCAFGGESVTVRWDVPIRISASSEEEAMQLIEKQIAQRGGAGCGVAEWPGPDSIVGSKSQMGRSFSWLCNMDIDDRADKTIRSSILNTLSLKRSQFQDRTPAVLVIKPEIHGVNPSVLADFVGKRIWPSGVHARISGIIFFMPHEDFSVDEQAKILCSWNPRADHLVPEALKDKFRARQPI